jgi:hypothetical protein
LANTKKLQQVLVEQQQAMIGYQHSIWQNVVALCEQQILLQQQKVAVGEGKVMEIKIALKGRWAPSTPEWKEIKPTGGGVVPALGERKQDYTGPGSTGKRKRLGVGQLDKARWILWNEMVAWVLQLQTVPDSSEQDKGSGACDQSEEGQGFEIS